MQAQLADKQVELSRIAGDVARLRERSHAELQRLKTNLVSAGVLAPVEGASPAGGALGAWGGELAGVYTVSQRRQQQQHRRLLQQLWRSGALALQHYVMV